MPGVLLPQLRELRERKALTQEELAAKSGIGRVTISVIERGGRARVPTARQLAKALGVEPAELMAK